MLAGVGGASAAVRRTVAAMPVLELECEHHAEPVLVVDRANCAVFGMTVPGVLARAAAVIPNRRTPAFESSNIFC
jgi:hypothetical protein